MYVEFWAPGHGGNQKLPVALRFLHVCKVVSVDSFMAHVSTNQLHRAFRSCLLCCMNAFARLGAGDVRPDALSSAAELELAQLCCLQRLQNGFTQTSPDPTKPLN